MNERGLKTLEYHKIIDMLKTEAGGEMTRGKIAFLKPERDLDNINRALKSTEEGVMLITEKGSLPLGNFYDISGLVSLCNKGAALTMEQLLKISYNLKVSRDTKKFMSADIPKIPILEGMCDVLSDMGSISDAIDKAIESDREMSSRASNELGRIRRTIDRKNEDIRVKINRIIGRGGDNTMLRDAIVTIREGRYVIPVKQEYRGSFPGIIHDKSASGATLFIEPQAVVNLNNQLKELAAEEQAEIDRILAELSGRVGEKHEEIINNQKLLVELDFIMAKSRLAVNLQATKPNLAFNSSINIKKARHPLIDPQKVVPLNIRLKDASKAVIITGPNTGGKTVTLKTLGLLSLMAQSGLFIPAEEGSKLPVFKNVFADIGDEQSIEQSLSTFSSHMVNIVSICDDADGDALILLDELGAGTDPTEGAAIAIAVLEELIKKGATILATTHYTELKKYAVTNPVVENASMEFDVETLSPTYKLILGMPGKSNAFEISRKLGLSSNIIESARKLLDKDAMKFEDVIASISREKKAAEEERDEALELNLAMKEAKARAEKQLAQAKYKGDQLIEKSRKEAGIIINEARATAKEVREELKKLQKIESLGERNKAMTKVKKSLDEATKRYTDVYVPPETYTPAKLEQLRPGTGVRVISLGQKGTVAGFPDSNGEITVRIGNMKIKCKPKGLELVIDGVSDPISERNRTMERKVKKTETSYRAMYMQKTGNISREIHVRGQSPEEALANVEKYLDDAFVAGLKEVRIVHGRGEGILRTAIRDMLKKHPHVSEFKRADYNEGGDGVTEAILK